MRNCLSLMMVGFAVSGIALGQARSADTAPTPDRDLVACIHFVGATKIAHDPNAAVLNEITAMPATAPMVAQAMQKLANTPHRLYKSLISPLAQMIMPR